MKWIASMVALVFAFSQFSVIAAEPNQSVVVADSLADLKSRIRILRGKGAKSILAFYEVTGEKGGYRVLFNSSNGRPATEVQTVFVDLYVAANFAKGASELVCTHKATQSLCTRKFDPEWLVEPKNANPTVQLLAAWTQETEGVVEPLWVGLCGLAAEKTGKTDYCDLSPN
jgi:hypothetical protein